MFACITNNYECMTSFTLHCTSWSQGLSSHFCSAAELPWPGRPCIKREGCFSSDCRLAGRRVRLLPLPHWEREQVCRSNGHGGPVCGAWRESADLQVRAVSWVGGRGNGGWGLCVWPRGEFLSVSSVLYNWGRLSWGQNILSIWKQCITSLIGSRIHPPLLHLMW